MFLDSLYCKQYGHRSDYSLECPIKQSVARQTADLGATSLIPAWSHTFMEIDHEIISTVILLVPLILRRDVVSYKRKYVHEVLINRLVKLDHLNMTIAVDRT